MSGNSSELEVLPNLAAGILDNFGTGNVVNYAAQMFAIPSALAVLPQSDWSVMQWGQGEAVNTADYIENSPSTYDDLYGDALYAWSEPGNVSAISLYQNTPALGGGDVVQLTDSNTLLPPSSGLTDESDMFLTSPEISSSEGSFANPLTLTLNAKITSSIEKFLSSAMSSKYATSGAVFNTIDFGLDVRFNGADGLPIYTGYVQISPWSSDSSSPINYESGEILPGQNTQFVSTLLLNSDASLPVLPADQNAKPDTLSYNLNEYLYQALLASFSDFTGSQKAALLNPDNWSLSSMYFGLATNDELAANPKNPSQNIDVAQVSSTLQLSNISITTQQNQSYNTSEPPAQTATVDTNPQISYVDNTLSLSGTTDGGTYVGSVANIQYEYIYSGFDNISLTAPQNGNWYFGGGNSATSLTAVSGNNIFLASIAGSNMTGGSGDDTFVIPITESPLNLTSDTISNFHVGDVLVLNDQDYTLSDYSWSTYVQSGSKSGIILSLYDPVKNTCNEQIFLVGLTLNDISHIKASIDTATGYLTFMSMNTGSVPVITYSDITSAQSGYFSASQINTSASGSAVDVYLYDGSDKISMTAPQGENWDFGGGSGFTVLQASSGNNIFQASTKYSIMIGGTGLDTFEIPDATMSSTSTKYAIANFHVGDSAVISGISGSDWNYQWINNSTNLGYTGLTLLATNTNSSTTEAVTFSGLDVNDLSHMTISAQGTNNELKITSNSSSLSPVMLDSNLNSGQSGFVVGSSTGLTANINAEYLYTGSQPMQFIAPNIDGNWEFGGGTAATVLQASSGNNILVASTSGSTMTGGSGDNVFSIPTPIFTGKQFFDSITDMHFGDSVLFSGLSSSDLMFSSTGSSSPNTGLTLEVISTNNSIVFGSVDFTNLTSADQSHLSIAALQNGSVSIVYT